VKAWLILADAAQVEGGKLFVLGGGIYLVGPGPFNMGIGMQAVAPWADRGRRLDIRIVLRDGNNQPALVPTPGGAAPLEVGASFEIAPSAGTPPGSWLPFNFAFNVAALPLAAGDYSWCLYFGADENVTARARFSVRAPAVQARRPEA
jgi:hypothetical protein